MEISGHEEQEFVVVEKDDCNDDLSSQPAEETNTLHEWLQPTEYLSDSSEFQKHLQTHVSGTGNWIQNSETYQNWLQSTSHGALWVKAPAGMGKSVLAATIVSKLIATDVPVLFFFFRHIIATNRNPHNLVRDFISQVLPRSPMLQKEVQTYINNGRSVDDISTNELWKCLLHALEQFPRAYCIVDRLDEMDLEREDFMLDLIAGGACKPDSIKILMTGRPLSRIEKYLRDPSILELKLERGLINEDISAYVKHRLHQVKYLTADLRTSFSEQMQQKTQGSFLYARLVVDELIGHLARSDAETSLESFTWLPHSLEDMYNGMLSDHSVRSDISQELQLLILRCVTHSTRPLRLLELAALLHDSGLSALIKVIHTETLQDQKTQDFGCTKALVRSACGPLLEILPDETISVIHHSFTEFLLDADRQGRYGGIHRQFPVVFSMDTHCMLAMACLKYMECLAEWQIMPRTSMSGELDAEYGNRLQRFKMEYPFLDYAIHNWHAHIRKLEVLNGEQFFTTLFPALDDFMENNREPWLDLVWPSAHNPRKPGSTRNSTPLHVAAWSGLTSYSKHLMNNGALVHCKGGEHMTPLSWAALKGNTDIVALLLQHDPPENYETRLYHSRTPLHFAAQANHHVVVHQLLMAGADPLAKKSTLHPGRQENDSCFYFACRAGSVESVRHMVPYLPTDYLTRPLTLRLGVGRKK